LDPKAVELMKGEEMLFLVRLDVDLPDSLFVDEVAALRADEAAVAASLADDGVLLRLWRSVGSGVTWGLWEAPNELALAAELDRLPLRPYFTVTVMELTAHPNDPVTRAASAADAEAGQGVPTAGSTMTAIVKTSHGPSSVALVQWPVPRPGPGSVLVEVHAAGVCGTDLHIADDGYPTRPPVVMGHEVAGVVVVTGAGVDRGWLGARVACETHHQVCDCIYCRDGRRNLCFNKASMGSFLDGGFASHVVVPATLLHRLPDALGDHAAALGEPLACVCHLLLDPPVVGAGDRVLVTGPGPMGLLAAQVARACGSSVTVVGLPSDAPRLAVATRLGFATANTTEPEAYDVAVECSGSAGGATSALEAVRRGGRYVSVGIFGRPVTLPMDQVLYKELVVTSGFAATAKSWRRALRLIEDGSVDLPSLISSVEPLSAWESVFADLTRSDRLKIVFDPRLPG
jgi:L-iditol 2-dehydrogenase